MITKLLAKKVIPVLTHAANLEKPQRSTVETQSALNGLNCQVISPPEHGLASRFSALTPMRQPEQITNGLKQDKTALINQAKARGHEVNTVLVTRRQQDFMFSHAAYSTVGFCQGFVAAIFSEHAAFSPTLVPCVVAKRAQSLQSVYTQVFRQAHWDVKKHFYQSLGFQLGERLFASKPEALVTVLQKQSAHWAKPTNASKTMIYYDLHFSGGERPDHSAGIAIEVMPDATFNTAVIDADRGIRRQEGLKDLAVFFQDLKKQSSDGKTKSGQNRKFHSWQKRQIVIRQLHPINS